MTIIDQLKQSELSAQIDALLHHAGDSPNNDLFRELIISVLRMVEDNAERGNIKIAHSALREMRYAFKVFGQYKTVRKISVFGSARTNPDEPSYKLAAEFAERVVEEGFMVITGGGALSPVWACASRADRPKPAAIKARKAAPALSRTTTCEGSVP